MRYLAILLVGFSSVVARAPAQEPPAAVATPEHEWLEQFVGKWQATNQAYDAEGQLVMTCEGTSTARMLGPCWLVSEVTGDLDGTTIEAVQTIGYDPKTKKYIGTWVDSVSNHMWKYVGSVDETGKVLTLEAEGPNYMDEGKITKYRDAYEFKDEDNIVTTSSMLSDDGEWIVFMKGDMRRVDQ